jgi:hypothetical protein
LTVSLDTIPLSVLLVIVAFSFSISVQVLADVSSSNAKILLYKSPTGVNTVLFSLIDLSAPCS